MAEQQFQPHTRELLQLNFDFQYISIEDAAACLSALTSTRKAERDFKQLREWGYLKARRYNVNTPLVHSVTLKTVRYLNRDRGADQQLPVVRDEAAKQITLEHEIQLSHDQTAIYLAAEAHPAVAIVFWQRRYKRPVNQLRYLTSDGTPATVIPDLGFLARFANGSELHHKWERDMGSEEPAIVLAKLRAYDAWYYSVGRQYLHDLYADYKARDPKPVYRRIVATQASPKDRNDYDRVCKLITQAMALPEATRANLFFTTTELLRARTESPALLEATLLPMKLARSWQGEYDELTDWLDQQNFSDAIRTKQLYAWGRKMVPKLTHWTLFPPRRA